MMRALLFIPLAVLLVCSAGWASCALMNWPAYPREMLIAAATCLVAGAFAIIPMVVVRSATNLSSTAVAQAALIATMIHVFGCIGVAAVIFMMKIPVAPAFTYWLAAMYWTTLGALATGLVADIKSLSARATTQKQ
jgi:hypothetical protein